MRNKTDGIDLFFFGFYAALIMSASFQFTTVLHTPRVSVSQGDPGFSEKITELRDAGIISDTPVHYFTRLD